MAIYRHTRACSLIYARADMKAAGERSHGDGGGLEEATYLAHSLALGQSHKVPFP